jgi:hypothetical protein
MDRDKLLILVLFVTLLAAAAGLRLIGSGPAEPVERSDRPIQPTRVGEFRGMSLQIQSGYASHPYEQYIDEIAETGANTISLVIAGYQENASSTSIFVDLRKTPPDGRLGRLIAHARKRGLRVVFMPIVLLENARAGEWRGKINPTDWNDWWEDYYSFILHYARVAQAGGVDVFIVGSELVSTESQSDKWRALIRQVRDRYKGRLSYSANWDHYRQIDWWDALDMIGMTTYYDLTGGKEATEQRLAEAWKRIQRDILAWQKAIDRPILFTEVGWPNQQTAAQYPWDYYRAQDRPAPQLQARLFKVFFDVWADHPAVGGVLVWEWRSYPQQPTGPDEPGYLPCGKPALEVIRRYYRRPGLSADTQPTGAAPATTIDDRDATPSAAGDG